MTEANAILVAACSRFLGSKPVKPQVKAITTDMERLAMEHFPQPKKGKKRQVLAIAGQKLRTPSQPLSQHLKTKTVVKSLVNRTVKMQ